MTGINGFSGPSIPILPAADPAFTPTGAPDIKSYGLTVDGPLPDTGKMPPEELFDDVADLIKDSGSEELKAALQNGETFVLNLTDLLGNSIDILVDASNGMACAVNDNKTLSGSGTSSSPPMHNIGGGFPGLEGFPGIDVLPPSGDLPQWNLPPFLEGLLKPGK